jgi:hypothetical protein
VEAEHLGPGVLSCHGHGRLSPPPGERPREEAPEGGHTARAAGESIFIEADDIPQLYANVRDAARCHFDERKGPKIAEELMEIQHKYPGLEVVDVGQPVGTPEAVILEQLDRFAAQVIPAFKRT